FFQERGPVHALKHKTPPPAVPHQVMNRRRGYAASTSRGRVVPFQLHVGEGRPTVKQLQDRAFAPRENFRGPPRRDGRAQRSLAHALFLPSCHTALNPGGDKNTAWYRRGAELQPKREHDLFLTLAACGRVQAQGGVIVRFRQYPRFGAAQSPRQREKLVQDGG